MPPGSLIHIGDIHQGEVKVRVIDYTETYAQELLCDSPEDFLKFRDTESSTWINVEGLHDVKLIEQIGTHFKLHPLLLEDILNTGHRPKAEDFTDYLFFTLKILSLHPETHQVLKEQVSFVLGDKFLISFQEKSSNVFDSVRERVLGGLGKARQRKNDYLFYQLLDTVVDNYFIVTEALGDSIYKLENEVVKNKANDQVLKRILRHRKDLITLRKLAIPLREAIAKLERVHSPLVADETYRYLTDVHDHALQIIDSIDTFGETLNNILEVQLSHSSNRMNQVIKVLTVISTIFMPLTFLVGVYGMNFKYMPELSYPYAYPIVWLIMIAIALTMLNYFRKKDWL